MKKITQFVGMLCLLPILSMGQITITETDMGHIGDVIIRQVDTLPFVVPGGAGANQTWDMTDAVSALQEVTHVLAPSSTPYSSGFPTSNLAMTNDSATFLYFEQTPTSLIATGFAGDIIGTGTAINVTFNPTALVHNFPRTYGDNFIDDYGLDITTDGSAFNLSEIRYKRVATAYDSTDGWGTILTPDGSYDVLRIKHVEYFKDSIWAKLLPITPFTLFSSTIDTTVAYNWVAKNSKLAVAELTVDSVGNPTQFTWIGTSNVGIENGVSSTIQANMYPLPAANQVNIRLANHEKPGAHVLAIYNLEGRLIATEKMDLEAGKPYTIKLNQFSSGIYTWTLRNEANLHESHGKLPIVK